jgi:hypothetical protein
MAQKGTQAVRRPGPDQPGSVSPANEDGGHGRIMSGETEADISGWTVDTLHQHFQIQLVEATKYFQSLIDGQNSAMTRRMDDQLRMLDERYATSVKALDAAFLAQQTAMRTALEAAEKAVATALTSAEKAVTKAEVAAEKRFEAVNEFRGQLSDQAATFLSRTEADVRIGALGEKVDQHAQLSSERISQIDRRLDLTQGKSAGLNAGWLILVGVVSLILALVGIFAYVAR